MNFENLFSLIKSFKSKFWVLNLILMIERLTYAALVLQMAVYLSQKDLNGGLGWEHTTKGMIFFIWAIVQNITPTLFGGLADKYGKKKLIIYSTLLISLGYFLLGINRELIPFILSTFIYGVGAGLFKPSIQGWLANNMSNKNESLGWGIIVMLSNFAVFFSPLLANYLQNLSWLFFFFGCGIIILLNLLLVLILRDDDVTHSSTNNSFILLSAIKSLFESKIIIFILAMSGFTMIYMQFYETLPNFIYDWVDNSDVIRSLHLPTFMQMTTSRGQMIDFKWLYNINSGLIVLFVVIISWLISSFKTLNGIILGLVLSTMGLFISGYTHFGWIGIIGMGIYTFGEMITNPKFTEFLSKSSGKENRSMFIGFLNLSMAIGLAFGSLLGGYLYKNLGDKYTFALKYCNEFYPNIKGITITNSFDKLGDIKKLSPIELTNFLWNIYHPNMVWIPFLVIGIISIITLFWYSKKFK